MVWPELQQIMGKVMPQGIIKNNGVTRPQLAEPKSSCDTHRGGKLNRHQIVKKTLLNPCSVRVITHAQDYALWQDIRGFTQQWKINLTSLKWSSQIAKQIIKQLATPGGGKDRALSQKAAEMEKWKSKGYETYIGEKKLSGKHKPNWTVTLNVNRLNNTTKRQRLSGWILKTQKQNPTTHCLQNTIYNQIYK